MKSKSRISFIKSILVLFITTLLFSTLYNPLSVTAADVVVEADYADIELSTNGSKPWYSTYCIGSGKKGQGVLVYLLERDGGGAVAGTKPVAFACDDAILSHELRAQDKYNRYPMVTKWEDPLPYWAETVRDNGAIMHSITSYNTDDIKKWLKTPSASGNSTKGIWMVQTIWGDTACDRFTNEEIFLVVEPILSIQFASYWRDGTLDTLNMNMSFYDMMDTIEAFGENVKKNFISTGLSSDFSDWIWNYVDKDNPDAYYRKLAASPFLDDKTLDGYKQMLLTQLETMNIGTNIYNLVGDPIAGTPKKIVEYYNELKASNTIANRTIAQSGINWYRKAAHTSAYIPTGSIVCANANFNLWNQGKTKIIQCHSDYNITHYSIGMIAMLAKTSDGDPLQSTWDQPTTTPHPAPQESTGNVTIIKSYRTVDSTTNIPISDDGTFTKSDVANIIQIEDEPIYRLVEWRISNSPKPDNLTSLNWETTVPSHIHSTGTKETTVTLPPTHTYLYVLLEKSIGDEPIEANYLLSQSSISRHINLNTPDQSKVAGKDMKLLSTITFKWNIGAHHECTGHVYYTRCGGTNGCGQRRYCSSPCGDTNGDGKVNKNDDCTPLGVIFLLKI